MSRRALARLDAAADARMVSELGGGQRLQPFFASAPLGGITPLAFLQGDAVPEPLPPALVPPEVNLRDFPFMPLEVARLRRSKGWLVAKRNPELGFYMLNLWGASWHETPAASLEDDDDVLADAAMCDPKRWAKIKEMVLRGWVKCDDGRWYHPVVAEKALEAWSAKLKQRKRTAAATKARQATMSVHNMKNLGRNDDRNDVESEDRNVDRDVDVTFTKGQGREGIGKGHEEEKEKVVEVRAPRAEVEALPDIPEFLDRRESTRGTRWPPDAVVPDDWRREGELRRVENGLVGIDLTLEGEKFANYWAGKSGQAATKVDWKKTWINWALKAEGTRNGNGKLSAHDKGTLGAAMFLAEVERRGNGGGTGTPGDGVPKSGYGFQKVVDPVPDVFRGFGQTDTGKPAGRVLALPPKPVE